MSPKKKKKKRRKPHFQDEFVRLYQGDARKLPLASESVQTCITSPPYWGQRDYGNPDQLGLEKTPEAYIANMLVVCREIRRVLKDDGTLWLNIGDSYASAPPGNKVPRSQRNYGGEFDKSGGPAAMSEEYPEDEIKPLYGVLAARMKNSTRVNKVVSGLKPKDLVGIPWQLAFALRADGWFLRSDIIWAKPSYMPEAVYDRPTVAHEHIFLLAKSSRYYYDVDAIRDDPKDHHGATWDERKAMGFSGKTIDAIQDGKAIPSFATNEKGRNKGTVWTVNPSRYKGAHFATFPMALIKPCILAGCPEGGTVLDPFCGTGTALWAAREFGRKGVGVELSTEYLELAHKRLRNQLLPIEWE